MGVSFKRKLYPRGGSYETTLPIQLLFSLDMNRKYDVLFEYDKDKKRWYIDFSEMKDKDEKKIKR